MSSTYKKCPKCNSNRVAKNGSQYGRKRFKCKDCGKQFQSKSQKSRKKDGVITELVSKKNSTQN